MSEKGPELMDYAALSIECADGGPEDGTKAKRLNLATFLDKSSRPIQPGMMTLPEGSKAHILHLQV